MKKFAQRVIIAVLSVCSCLCLTKRNFLIRGMGTVSDPYSSNPDPDPAKTLNPDMDPVPDTDPSYLLPQPVSEFFLNYFIIISFLIKRSQLKDRML